MKINKRHPFIVAFLKLLSPGYACCQKCGLPWNHCKHKCVYTSLNSGTFATCDVCWDNSTLEELKMYYNEVYLHQWRSSFGNIGFKMEHSLEHLLKCVEKEYFKSTKK